jgi:nitroimidazol reductase NimA-like FMN-containing flavoprotein (pyridoxamine 5'-phosphate oxidase superfamily)
MATPRPHFRELTREESLALLARNQVGRLAFAHRDRIDIEPLHYTYSDGWLYGRTTPGAKLEAIAHHRWVAFEVDEIEARFDWRSVVVKGAIYLLRADGSDAERAQYAEGVTRVRAVVPEAFTPDDPLPERAILFRIHIDDLTGRAATTR